MFIPNAQTSGYQIGGGSGDSYNVIRAEDKVIAFPPTAVKAGTVLATLGSTYWNGTQEVANPYIQAMQPVIIISQETMLMVQLLVVRYS